MPTGVSNPSEPSYRMWQPRGFNHMISFLCYGLPTTFQKVMKAFFVLTVYADWFTLCAYTHIHKIVLISFLKNIYLFIFISYPE